MSAVSQSVSRQQIIERRMATLRSFQEHDKRNFHALENERQRQYRERRRRETVRIESADDVLRGRRSPPHDPAAERSLLSAVTWSPSARAMAFERIDQRDFYLPWHQCIFEVLKAIYLENRELDALIVKDRLCASGMIEEAGGEAFVDEVLTTETSGLHIGEYIEILLNQTIARRLHWLGIALISDVHSGTQERMPDVLDRAAREVLEIASRRQSDDGGIGIEAIWAEAKNVQDGKAVQMIPTGITTLDRSLGGGLQKGEMSVNAAYSGGGKTAYLCNQILHLLTKTDYRCALFPLEMSVKAITGRMVGILSGVNTLMIRQRNFLGSAQENAVREAMETLKDWENSGRLVIQKVPNASAAAIRARCLRLKSGKGLDFVGVDYVQLMGGDGKGESAATMNASANSTGMKRMAEELELGLVLNSQFIKPSSANASGLRSEPQIWMLKQTGALENDADLVQILWDDGVIPPPIQGMGVVRRRRLKVCKNRDGQTFEGSHAFVLDFFVESQFMQEHQSEVRGQWNSY